MTRCIVKERTTDIVATGVVAFKSDDGVRDIKKIPTNGHYHWGLTGKSKTAGGAPAATILLKGTNNEDPGDTNGETLATLSFTAAEQKDASAANKAYRFVFVHVTALTDLEIDSVQLFGSGYAGTL